MQTAKISGYLEWDNEFIYLFQATEKWVLAKAAQASDFEKTADKVRLYLQLFLNIDREQLFRVVQHYHAQL